MATYIVKVKIDFYIGNSNKKEKENNTIDSTASNDSNDVVDNLSDPSFLRGFRLKNPEMQEPLYGQVISPPQVEFLLLWLYFSPLVILSFYLELCSCKEAIY